MAPNTVYMIVLMDSASDNYDHGVLHEKGVPARAYVSLDAAKSAVASAASKFDEFMPTAYGKAFPYDTATFEQELERAKFAPWGWGVLNVDDEIQRVCIGLIAVLVE
jgi:hypothetical protein